MTFPHPITTDRTTRRTPFWTPATGYAAAAGGSAVVWLCVVLLARAAL